MQGVLSANQYESAKYPHKRALVCANRRCTDRLQIHTTGTGEIYMSQPRKILIAIPPAMLEQVDYLAQVEHRTRSDLVREALRKYLQAHQERMSRCAPGVLSQKPITENIIS